MEGAFYSKKANMSTIELGFKPSLVVVYGIVGGIYISSFCNNMKAYRITGDNKFQSYTVPNTTTGNMISSLTDSGFIFGMSSVDNIEWNYFAC